MRRLIDCEIVRSDGVRLGAGGATLVPDLERDPSERGIIIRRNVVERWRALDDQLRARVAAVLSDSPQPGLESIVIGQLPEAFADDLASGGRQFRAAFPDLVRAVVSINIGPSSIDVIVSCDGRHIVPFFGLIAPTLRDVRFELAHQFALEDNHGCLEHRIYVDVRRVVAQLGTGPRSPAAASAFACITSVPSAAVRS